MQVSESEQGQDLGQSEKPPQKRGKRARRAFDDADPRARDTKGKKGLSLFAPQHEAIVKAWYLVEGLAPEAIGQRTGASAVQIRTLAKNRGWDKQRRALSSYVDQTTQDKLSATLQKHADSIERTQANSIATAAQASALAKRDVARAKRDPGALASALEAQRLASSAVSTFARLTPELTQSPTTAQPQAHLHLHLASQWQPRKVDSTLSQAPQASDVIDLAPVSAPE